MIWGRFSALRRICSRPAHMSVSRPPLYYLSLYRARNIIGFLGNPCLCCRIKTRQSRHDGWPVLRSQLRPPRYRFGIFRWLADRTSIEFVFQISTLLPLLGVITVFANIESKLLFLSSICITYGRFFGHFFVLQSL